MIKIYMLCNKKSNKNGFTLVELLVVIAIIGILAAVIAPNVFAAIEKGKAATLVQDIETIKTAAYLYYVDTGEFPGNVVDGANAGYVHWNDEARASFLTGENYTSPLSVSGSPVLTIPSNWDGPYLDKWPERTPFGGVYVYRVYDVGSWGHINLQNKFGQSLPNNKVEMVWVRLEDSQVSGYIYAEEKAKADRIQEILEDYIEPALIFRQPGDSGFGRGTVRILIRSH